VVALRAQHPPHRTATRPTVAPSMTFRRRRRPSLCRRAGSWRAPRLALHLPLLTTYLALALLATAPSARAEPAPHSTATAPHTATTAPPSTATTAPHAASTTPHSTTTPAPRTTTTPHTATTTPHSRTTTAPHTTAPHTATTVPHIATTAPPGPATTTTTASTPKAVHHTLRYIAGAIVLVLIGGLGAVLLMSRRRPDHGVL